VDYYEINNEAKQIQGRADFGGKVRETRNDRIGVGYEIL